MRVSPPIQIVDLALRRLIRLRLRVVVGLTHDPHVSDRMSFHSNPGMSLFLEDDARLSTQSDPGTDPMFVLPTLEVKTPIVETVHPKGDDQEEATDVPRPKNEEKDATLPKPLVMPEKEVATKPIPGDKITVQLQDHWRVSTERH